MPDLSDARRHELIARVSAQLCTWHLREPAIVFLAMHSPLAFLGSQLLLVAQPFLGTAGASQFAYDCALVFQDPENVNLLLDRLEQDARGASFPPS
jgi:hypothetical protein